MGTTKRKWWLTGALTAFCVTVAGPAVARPLGVVELFTSQGCNSCPPADAALERIIRQGGVVALAYHIDYWDYLGWKDTLGSRANTERQYAYAKAFGTAQVYTPQAVLNRRSDANGASLDAVENGLQGLTRSGEGLSVDMSIRDEGDAYVVDAGAAPDGAGEARLVLVSFSPKRDVPIRHGENSGRTVTYWHAVTGVRLAGMWRGKSARYEIPKTTASVDGGVAVLLQSGNEGPGPILGAAILDGNGS